MKDTRDRFIKTTSLLMETQGYHATGLNQITKESGAPKGSLYYYFPEGKEELASVAIQRTGENFARLIIENLQEDIPLQDSIREFVLGVAKGVEESNFSSGGPLTAVAMETASTNERLNLACKDAFLQIQSAFETKLTAGNIPTERAKDLSVFITSAIEGGIILSRTYHSSAPLRSVAENLYQLIKASKND